MKLVKLIDRLIVCLGKKVLVYGQFCLDCTNFQLPFLMLIISFSGILMFFVLLCSIGLNKGAAVILLYTFLIQGICFFAVKTFDQLCTKMKTADVEVDQITTKCFWFLRLGLLVLAGMVLTPFIRLVFDDLGNIIVVIPFATVQVLPVFAFLLATIKIEECR